MSWFKRCKHEWAKITERMEGAPIDRLKNMKKIKGDSEIMYKTYILILQCKKCGKLDKTVEKV